MKHENPLTQAKPEPDPEQLIREAIFAYYEKYSQEGRQLIKPGIKASSVGKSCVYLRTGIHLLAVWDYSDKRFLKLTDKLIEKHSKPWPPVYPKQNPPKD